MIQSFLLVSILLITVAIFIRSSNKDIIKGKEIFNIELTNAYRGVAILMVIIQHCSGKLGTNVFTPLGGMGVAVFLVLSGFGLSESYKKKGITGICK